MTTFRASTRQRLGLFSRAGAVVAGSCAAGLVLTGCPTGGTLENPECYETGDCSTGGGGSSGPCDGAVILVEKCQGGFCHGTPGKPPSSAGLVDLVNPAAGMTMGETLLNTPATYPFASTSPGECPPAAGAELYINGSNASASLVLTKVTGTLGAGFACGEVMVGTTALTTQDKECLANWVAGVAAGMP